MAVPVTLVTQGGVPVQLVDQTGTTFPTTGTGSLVFNTAPTLINPIVGTQAPGNNTTLAASTAFVQAAIGGISTGLTVGTTTIASGTTTRILYDNAGVLGEYTLTGSGTVVAMQTNPAFLGTVAVSGATTTGPDFEVSMTGDTNARVAIGLNTTDVPRLSFGPGNAVRDLFLERVAAANLRHGGIAVDTAPIAQTISVQNVLAGGTSNVAGANFTLAMSQGKGTGVGGSFVLQVAPAGSTGTAVNALVTALSVASTGATTITSASPSALTVGLTGATNPALRVDASAASQAAGLLITGATTSGTVSLSLISSGTNNNLTLDAKGSGTFVVQGTATGNITLSRTTIASNNLTVNGGTLGLAASTQIAWNAQTVIASPSDGLLTLYNTAGTSFGRIQLGGTTSSFPSIKRNGTAINFRLADDSADAPITASSGTFSTTLATAAPAGSSAGLWKFGALQAGVVTVDTTRSIYVDIGGTVYHLMVST